MQLSASMAARVAGSLLCDIDLVVSGDGDERVLIYEQTDEGAFREHVLEQSLGQAGGVTFADLDGDGDEELVMTGYEDDAIYIYETVIP